MSERRVDEEYRRKEKIKDRIAKEQNRNTKILKYRENVYNQCLGRDNGLDKLKLEFIKIRSNLPDRTCCCCEGLFFLHSVVKYNVRSMEMKLPKDFLDTIYNFASKYICRTCYVSVLRVQMPKLSTSNGLKFPDVPECVRTLSSLEERMVAPFIDFMQIRPLKAYALNPQLGMKGSVVNIPVEINKMIDILPRKFNEMATIQIKLKRHVQHKSDYMYETIRPAAVCKALDYLVTTELYRKNNIEIDPAYVARYGNMDNNAVVNFLVDGNDHENETLSCLKDLKEDDFLDENEVADVQEVMVVDGNLVDAEMTSSVKVIAPGQGQKPVPWHAIDNIDELCFPKIFGGIGLVPKGNITYHDRAKSECRRWDRRSCIPERLFFMAKKKMELATLSSMNTCLRKTKIEKNINVSKALDKDYVNQMCKLDEGYRYLKKVRPSPAYWEQQKKNVMAMIRQLGRPTFFVTLSANEKNWPELIRYLAKVQLGEKLTTEKALNLDDAKKTQLVRNDPVTCARYFDYRTKKLDLFLKKPNGFFGEYTVTDSYARVEFQQRGSPHNHILYWVSNAPKYDPDDPNSIEQCTKFIDTFLTCEYDKENPNVALQRHKHSYTCYKGKKNKKTCRFNYPVPMMPRTTILQPLSEDEMKERYAKTFERIKDVMNGLCKNEEDVSFECILERLKITEMEYVMAVRSSIRRTMVFLKRSSLEIAINSYNKDILDIWESNIDVQFVLEEYAVASYVINYIGKSEAGLSKLLRDAASDASNGNVSVKEKFRKIANIFLNFNLMSAQEAAYHILSLPLSLSSRRTVYINTCPIDERVYMLKSIKEMANMDPHSEDVYKDDWQKKYSLRPRKMENACMADFVAALKMQKKKENYMNDCDEDENDEVQEKRKVSVIRYRRYKKIQDPKNYFREQALLFLPWRNELEEIQNQDWEQLCKDNIDVIEGNRNKYTLMDEDIIDAALEFANAENEDVEQEEIDNFLADKLTQDQQIDIMDQDGKEIVRDKKANRYTIPLRIKKEEICESMYNLNSKQREFVMNVLHSYRTGNVPFQMFLSGSAGVGKSTVINCLYQIITYNFDSMPGAEKDKLVVLLCAPSGKAAFLINGVTLHTAFALPVTQYGGNMPELSSDIANTIREKLFHVKLLIIDEISMVGSTVFTRIDSRLRQITGINEDFGGIPVIAVGDMNQLPPVMDTVIYKMSKKNELWELFDVSPLWDKFCIYELTEIMRQKGEQEFIQALNNIATGQMTKDDIDLINTRRCTASDVPENAIWLFYTNKDVTIFNDKRIAASPEKLYKNEAEDVILGKISRAVKQKILSSLKKKPATETNGLPYNLKLKIGIKYMMTTNIDVKDGLVNGACGTLRLMTFNSNGRPERLWIDFGSARVGRNARSCIKNYMKDNGIDEKLTPIERTSVALTITNKIQNQTIRKQFPLVPAEALTIHKSQGQTYECVCLDMNKCLGMKRSMLYVAMSRATKLSGLHIIGKFRPPIPRTEDDATCKELNRMRTERPLKLTFNDLRAIGKPTIIYQNVDSLRKNIRFIAKDEWYGRGEVLIFSETLSQPSDVFDIENYSILFRSDATKNTRGIICFLRNGVQAHLKKRELEIGRDADGTLWHVETFLMEINDVLVMTGYKSPRTSNCNLQKAIAKLLSDEESTRNIVMIGDYNCDARIETNDVFLRNVCKNFILKSLLTKDDVTTMLNTQIDIVYGTTSFPAGVYETYFTYHKPIFVSLVEKNECENTSIDIRTERDQITMIVNDEESNENIMKMFQRKIMVCETMTANDFTKEILSLLEENREQLMEVRPWYNKCFGNKETGKIIDIGEAKISIVTTTGDGNCLYRAISYCLKQNENYYVGHKVLCAETIIRHRNYFEKWIRLNLIENVKNLKDLIVLCAKEKEYGNEGSLYALALGLEREIIVITTIDENSHTVLGIKPLVETFVPIIVNYTNPGRMNAHYNAAFMVEGRISEHEQINLAKLGNE